MQKENQYPTSAVIFKNFEIETERKVRSEAELFDILSQKIAYLLEYRTEFLLSLLYRMDVREAKVSAALHPAAPDAPHIGLTKLVLERQKERNRTREQYRQPPIEDLEEGLEF